jgi:hypothetical protein
VCNFSNIQRDFSFILPGKLSGLRYVTEILKNILKTRKTDRLTRRDDKELFYMDMLYGTSFDNWMSQVERTKSTINN